MYKVNIYLYNKVFLWFRKVIIFKEGLTPAKSTQWVQMLPVFKKPRSEHKVSSMLPSE